MNILICIDNLYNLSEIWKWQSSNMIQLTCHTLTRASLHLQQWVIMANVQLNPVVTLLLVEFNYTAALLTAAGVRMPFCPEPKPVWWTCVSASDLLEKIQAANQWPERVTRCLWRKADYNLENSWSEHANTEQWVIENRKLPVRDMSLFRQNKH